ncbi:hypothetical protein AB0H88_46510 [Nonomuraea sp. NPDC050680]|uniref:hypothetical protein n=1 Tax=Nonomuraea sp. NPDC050680 TaxID=3154630 RepID=UPI003408E670
MSSRALLSASLAALLIMAGCSSPPPQQDRRPLGNITAEPRECGLISRDAIARATGLDDFYADGTTSISHFAYCQVTRSPDTSEPAWMLIELRDPMDTSIQSLEATKLSDKGVSLPTDLGPGFSAAIKDKEGTSVGAYALAWMPDGSKLLSVRIARGAPGRDIRADAIEFAKQLKPFLLPSSPG